MSSISWNINRQNSDLKLYEFGNCYFYHKSANPYPLADDYAEKTSLDIFISGNEGRQSWNYKANPTDFFRVKSYVEMMLARLGVSAGSLSAAESDKKCFSESIVWQYKNKPVAEAGKISKATLAKFDISQDVYWGHVDWDQLLKMIKSHAIVFHELPKYPSVKRDLALLLDRSVKFSKIKEIAFRTERNLLHEVSLFDVYESESLGQNKKSYAVSFLLRDDLKTMTDKNIDKIMSNLIRAFESELGAQIR